MVGSILEQQLSLQIGGHSKYVIPFQQLLADLGPNRAWIQGTASGMPLRVNDIRPEFLLKALHEGNHHNHNVNPQSHANY